MPITLNTVQKLETKSDISLQSFYNEVRTSLVK